MSIFGAMSSSVSALGAQSNALGIISDNISNVNTVGFKDSQASFSTLVTQQASRTTFSPGGVRSTPLQNVGTQGLLQSSANNTDLGISGNGFFVVNRDRDPGVGDEFLFTRAGEFRADENGDLVNTAGFFLQGWPLDNQSNRPANAEAIESLETVNIGGLSGLPRATSTIDLGANLPSNAAEDDTHQMTVQIFDALGNAHNLTVEFTATGNADLWDVRVSGPVLAADPVLADGTPNYSGTFDGEDAPGDVLDLGSLEFNGDGSLRDIFDGLGMGGDGGQETLGLGIDFENGAQMANIDINFGSPGDGDLGEGGFDGVTRFANDFAVTEINQNGLRFGNFTGVNIDEQGTVTAVFDNGRRRDLAQLPVATFNNPNGLEAVSGNAFQRSDRSGELLLNQAGVGGAGDIAPSSLEGSTVDLATEFTRLITTQRAFSSATRIITTSDEMLQELTAIAR